MANFEQETLREINDKLYFECCPKCKGLWSDADIKTSMPSNKLPARCAKSRIFDGKEERILCKYYK